MAKLTVKTDPLATPLPADMREYSRGLYNCFPTFPLDGGISSGYSGLAELIAAECKIGRQVLVIDGYNGVDWEIFRQNLAEELAVLDITSDWTSMSDCRQESGTIRRQLEPFLGGDDPLFGTHYPYGPEVFFDAATIAELRIEATIRREVKTNGISIIYGCGAGLVEQWDQLWYIDIPKDVLQEQARSGSLTNLGEPRPVGFGKFYKRSYFVDWPAQNRQKRILLPRIDLLVDLQNPVAPAFMTGNRFRDALKIIARSPFRVRPWFYPGPWGGKYMQGHMGLDPERPNFAWSFELIAPENGITVEADGRQLEFSFDFLMYQENIRVLGDAAARKFLYEWPIRLDYLDTIDGGNLSTQVHPRPDYIRRNFGETYTQDETYYIANAKPGARVYVGLTEDCDQDEFRASLEESETAGKQVEIDKYVNSVPVRPHDLIMIPNGTVHCSGAGNLVLEISATPYIFTFKIYDYLRRDLDGNLRPMNIRRAFENIRPERRTAFIRDNYLARPRLIAEGAGWRMMELYDRPETFYVIHRLEFDGMVELNTSGAAYAINLVDGEKIELLTTDGFSTGLARFESMVVPAVVGSYRVINRGHRPAQLVLVFVRPESMTNKALNDPCD
ncbi:MAG: class I mannose-6-phosphate isomerase [Candidatus Neomarinimicrobiota bacterium]